MCVKKDGQWMRFVLVCFILFDIDVQLFYNLGINACNQPTKSESLFYNGYDLVEYFMRDANSKMVDYMNELATK